MTLDQKITMVHGDGYPGSGTGGKGAGAVPAIPSLCVPALGLADGAAGLGNGNTGVTAFPAPLAQAAAFDTVQQTAFGQALGQEFVGKGENQWLAPNVNIARYPLNGRNFEAYGEDPYLGSAVVDCTPVDPLTAITTRAAKNGDTVLFDNGSDPATAAATAARANVAIVFGYYTESEGSNRSTPRSTATATH